VKWIVVSERDRFGTADADEFIHYRYQLRRWGCRLYDATGADWTRKAIDAVIMAAVDGEKSEQEQHAISKRVLGGMVKGARAGEWQGGAVRLGLDVGCFDRATGKELWRVVLEGREKRVKVWPSGRVERFDGRGNFPRWQPLTEVLRLTPSKDKAKVQAAVSLFERYASEAVSFTALAHYLNALGIRSCYGRPFESRSVQDTLADPIYMGYASWNKTHQGKFHRHKDGTTVLEMNREGKQSRNRGDDWICSERLFESLVPLSTWNRVQEKLATRGTRAKAPHSHRHYLAGLLVCGHCGSPLVSGHGDRGGNGRYEYQCGSYTLAVRYKTERKCLRNGVYQDVIERFVESYLEETGRRLEVLTGGQGADHLTDHLSQQEGTAWKTFLDGFDRLTDYLARHHGEEYAAILRAAHERHEEDERALEGGGEAPPGALAEQLAQHPEVLDGRAEGNGFHLLDDFPAECVDLYRSRFDPSAVEAELAEL
jgi:hypothetical protein